MKSLIAVLLMLPATTFASYYTAIKVAVCEGVDLVEVRIGSFDSDRTVTETIHYEAYKSDVSVMVNHIQLEDTDEFHFTFDGVESFIARSYEYSRRGEWDTAYRLNGKLCKKL